MKLFVWDRADEVTGSWHPEAGIVIIAEHLSRAREILLPALDTADNRKKCSALTEDPDSEIDIGAAAERVWIFPDAGCC